MEHDHDGHHWRNLCIARRSFEIAMQRLCESLNALGAEIETLAESMGDLLDEEEPEEKP